MEGFDMEEFVAYLDLLGREQDCLDRLINIVREKRDAILSGDLPCVVSLSEHEDGMADQLMELRGRRRSSLGEIYLKAKQTGLGRGGMKQFLLSHVPTELKNTLESSLTRYESRVLDLRRYSRINHVLLRDRLALFDHVLEKAVSKMNSGGGYSPSEMKSKRPAASSATPSVLLDQVV